MFIFNKNKAAFTFVELIVASSVFVLFLGTLFAFYKLGSNLFYSGSWKIHTQAKTERFINMLRERLEQSADLIDVNQAGKIIEEKSSSVAVASGTFNLTGDGGATKINGKTRLLLFPICKPSLRSTAGLILHNTLIAVIDPNNPNLMALIFRSSRSMTDPAMTDPPISFQHIDLSGVDTSRFDAHPLEYSLGDDPAEFVLCNVHQIKIEPIDNKTLRIALNMRHPQKSNVNLFHSISVKLSVPVVGVL